MLHLNDGRNKTPNVECGRSLRSRPRCALIQARPVKAGFSLDRPARYARGFRSLRSRFGCAQTEPRMPREKRHSADTDYSLHRRSCLRGLPRPRTPAAYGFRFGAPSPSSRSPAAECSPRPCRVKLLCGGLRPALSGFAASGRRCRYFVTAPLPPRPPACSSFAFAHSSACSRAWPQGAKSRHFVGLRPSWWPLFADSGLTASRRPQAANAAIGRKAAHRQSAERQRFAAPRAPLRAPRGATRRVGLALSFPPPLSPLCFITLHAAL